MKFLLVVLVIRFVIELIVPKNRNVIEEDEKVVNVKIHHPSEFQLR